MKVVLEENINKKCAREKNDNTCYNPKIIRFIE
jgi:hypothetical protein